MNTSDFYYELPQELIAQTPPADRSASRLLLYDRNTRSITDGEFSDVASHLHPGDVLVRNTTRVIPARLIGVREDTGGHMEFLLLRRAEGDRWECLAKPARRARPGQEYRVGDGLRVRVLGDTGAEGGKLVELLYDGILEEVLDRVGQTPLPPYITERLEDPERYQTVYARERGSAAAPTAGLHFTQALLDRLRAPGVRIVDVLLHVGLGTFRPVSAERVEDHHMHAEYCEVTAEAAAQSTRQGRPAARVCRGGDDFRAHAGSAATPDGLVQPFAGQTSIFITPGYAFRAVDALITNFHLPESTLLMLVSAFAGREEMLRVYRHAVQQRYRFFSFGDAMLIE